MYNNIGKPLISSRIFIKKLFRRLRDEDENEKENKPCP